MKNAELIFSLRTGYIPTQYTVPVLLVLLVSMHVKSSTGSCLVKKSGAEGGSLEVNDWRLADTRNNS